VAFFLTILVGLGILALLQILPNQARKPIIALVTFLGGLYYTAEFFIPVPTGHDGNFLSPYMDTMSNIASVLGCFSVGLGIISLIGLHFKNTIKLKASWGFSATLIVCFVVMTIFTLLDQYSPKGMLIPKVANKSVYQFLFSGGLTSLDAAMFALIGFFIISASYRAFRIRSLEASYLMASAVIVMLGQVTLGSALTHNIPHAYDFFKLENLSEYILAHINSPAQRAVTFGLALGALATSLRLWLSLERGLYFDQEA
jgi:hypothetical protein